MLGDQMRRYRKQCGYSQKDLASQLFVTQQAVGKWERGEATPNPEAIIKMAKIFGVSTDALLGENTSPVSSPTAHDDGSLMAAFFEGGEDLSQEEMDELWADAKDYIQYKLAQRRRKQDGQ